MPENAKLRRATLEDFDAIHAIWMQDDVNAFMTFEKELEKEMFRPIFEKLFKGSDIYVIEDGGQVVATRRIIYGSGEYAHSVEFASFGVHEDHREKGYGTLFYQAFIDLLKKEKPHITRVEIGQETDNPKAFNLASKIGFKVEATFPEWITRQTGIETYTDKWRMGARFLGFLLDPEIEKQSIANTKTFTAKLPSLRSDNQFDKEIQIKRIDNKFYCYHDQKLLATCTQNSGVRRFGHIQFWSIELEPDHDPIIVEKFLRDLATQAEKTHKKVEIYISEQNVADIVTNLGFHCRGEKIASRKMNDTYYNEIGTDLSFFNIDDAKELLDKPKTKQINKDDYKLAKVKQELTTCKNVIIQASKEEQIDKYGEIYLENLAFQMTREGLGETRIYLSENAPWNTIIQQLPDNLKTAFINLANTIDLKLDQELTNVNSNQNVNTITPKPF